MCTVQAELFRGVLACLDVEQGGLPRNKAFVPRSLSRKPHPDRFIIAENLSYRSILVAGTMWDTPADLYLRTPSEHHHTLDNWSLFHLPTPPPPTLVVPLHWLALTGQPSLLFPTLHPPPPPSSVVPLFSTSSESRRTNVCGTS